MKIPLSVSNMFEKVYKMYLLQCTDSTYPSNSTPNNCGTDARTHVKHDAATANISIFGTQNLKYMPDFIFWHPEFKIHA